MHASLYRKVLLPLGLLVLSTIIWFTSLRGSPGFQHYHSLVSNRAANSTSTDGQEIEKTIDPFLDYTYEKIISLSAEKKIAKDPCIDASLREGGSEVQPVEGTKVLVTGGAGFIGSNLVDRLLQLGYKVRIFDNLYTGFIRNVPLDNSNVELFVGDILDKNALEKAMEGIDFGRSFQYGTGITGAWLMITVYHLAAMSKVVPSLKSSAMARFCTESNALGSWNVLDAVRVKNGVQKVIYAASSTYYGNQPAPHREDMAPDFLTPYAASKYEGELQMQMFDRLFGVPTISMRFFMVYGPRQPSTGAYAIVTGVFAKQASEGKPLTIEGDGSHYRDFIHVHDIVDGLILSQQSSDLGGDVVNLGTGSAYSVQDVANLVSSNQTHLPPRPNDLEGTLADTCKMKRLLGYKPKKNFKTEMAYMAKETMEGNVFMQAWFTPALALSAPHLLPVGSPMFQWPTDPKDLDNLLLAVERTKEKSAADEKSAGRFLSVITLPIDSEDEDQTVDLLLNTVFSLVRFGGVKSYIVAATNDNALSICLSLNLPCYDARDTGAPALLLKLVSNGYSVHLARLGNAYISDVGTALQKLDKDSSKADVLSADGQGDVFVVSNDRTKALFTEWIRAELSPEWRNEGWKNLFSTKDWPKLEMSTTHFPIARSCNQAATQASPSSFCSKGFYIEPRCEESSNSQNATTTARILKPVGAWHMSECQDKEHCDRQQVVPLRWISHPPDLASSGGIC